AASSPAHTISTFTTKKKLDAARSKPRINIEQKGLKSDTMAAVFLLDSAHCSVCCLFEECPHQPHNTHV
uniref:Uncharacterized protein n=1 Tax=Monopterus albus TaxID=43700 RepID=A0A3Q3J4N3_MONAL